MLTHLIPQILLLTYKLSFFWIVDNSSSFATGDMPVAGHVSIIWAHHDWDSVA